MKPRISRQAIDAVVADLYAARATRALLPATPSVRELAKALKDQYGFSGENRRLCEALRRACDAPGQPGEAAGEVVSAAWKYRLLALVKEFRRFRSHAQQLIATLQSDLAAMTARAERSEAREETTQSHWMMEVDKARHALADAIVNRYRGVDPEVHLSVCRELAAARQEIADLKARDRKQSPARLAADT